MKSLGYVHTPVAEHHRWSPYSRRAIASGQGGFDHPARLMLHQMRWRKPPRQVGVMLVAALLSLLVHLLGLASLLMLRPPSPAPAVARGEANAIQVRFIEARPRPPPPGVAPTPPSPVREPVSKTSPPATPAAQPVREVQPRVATAPVKLPPRVVPEVSPMAVPVPPITPAEAAPVTASTPESPAQPEVVVPRPGIRPQAPRTSRPRVSGVSTPATPSLRVARVEASAPAPARVISVKPPPTPAAANWAQQPDTFSKLPVRHPGQGTAEQRQSARGSPQGIPDYIQRQPQGNSDVMTRQYRGLHYKRTIFDQYWAPDNEGLLTTWLRKLVDTLSFHKTFDLGHGVRIHCGGWLLGFGCGGDPPDPMSKMSYDRRLNMAPAKPLVPGLGASVAAPPPAPMPASPSNAVTCETARVAGGPMPPGCPASARSGGGRR